LPMFRPCPIEDREPEFILGIVGDKRLGSPSRTVCRRQIQPRAYVSAGDSRTDDIELDGRARLPGDLALWFIEDSIADSPGWGRRSIWVILLRSLFSLRGKAVDLGESLFLLLRGQMRMRLDDPSLAGQECLDLRFLPS